jgi:ribonuclease Z
VISSISAFGVAMPLFDFFWNENLPGDHAIFGMTMRGRASCSTRAIMNVAVVYARGADVLVHEVVFGSGVLSAQQQFVVAGHTTPTQAAQVFAASRPRLAVYNHVLLLGAASDKELMTVTGAAYDGRVEMGVDLTVIDVADTISVRRLK